MIKTEISYRYDASYNIETGEFTEKVGFCDLTPDPETGYVCEYCMNYEMDGRPKVVPYEYRTHMELFYAEQVESEGKLKCDGEEGCPAFWNEVNQRFDAWVLEQKSKKI